MIKKLIPDFFYNSINDIPYTKLYEDGIRLILTDLDNTLISYKETEPTKELIEWKKMVESIGFEIIIVSNSRKNRVKHFAEILELPYVKFAKKPLKFGLKKAMKLAKRKYKLSEVVEIGDQLMTDVFASKRLNILTILVKAIEAKTEFFTTKFNRKLEKFFLRRIKKKYPESYSVSLLSYERSQND